MQVSQDVLGFVSALFPRNMAQTGASAILRHADVNYNGGRELVSGAHLLLDDVSPSTAPANEA